IKQFKIETQRVHQDTTTVTFHGHYVGSVSEPRITEGHNKDHRPDLKQFVFGLSVSSDGAVPLTHQVFSGNRSDDTVHRSNLEELRALLDRSDFIYVADSKLGSSANLQEIAAHGGRFVTVLARSRKEDQVFRERLRKNGVRWKTIVTIPNKRRQSEPSDVYASVGGLHKTAEGFRLIWIRSSAKALEDQAHRSKRLAQAKHALADLRLRLNRRRLRAAKAIRLKAREILQHHGMEPFLNVTLQRQVHERLKHLKVGRPSADDRVRRIKVLHWSLKVDIDRQRLRQEKRTDGVFP